MNIKETIESIYLTNTNYTDPIQAINQAESLKSLSSDLYTDSKRFIYELLQNADDSAIENKKVDVIIKLFDDTLVIAHTGKEFTNRDIQGLCSINNGTKKSDTSKTGYKGIGFKSVFGQSEKVTIFTNDEYFKFDAKYNLEWKEEWNGNQEEWEQANDREFLYPWQIIPIYLNLANNDLYPDIQNLLTNGNWNVATIIKISNQKEIQKAIKELSSNVNMFLFLKKINSIKFETDRITTIDIKRSESELILKKDTKIVAQWLINTTTLDVPRDLKELLKADENVPKKLQETDNIELTLAIKKSGNGLEKLSTSENLLYAYLPTDEKRYSLPILVNSTFLTSANRESLHTNSKWNQWLFKSISIELFKWIAELVKGEYSYQSYNLIPTKLSVDDDLSNAYNDGIEEAIRSIPFVLSKKNNLLKINEAVIDETNLSEKTFIGKKAIKKFVKHKVGEDTKIVESPFIASNKKLKNIGVATFSWSDIPRFFTFDDFKSEHTIEKNIQLIEYFKNESEISDSNLPKEKLKSWAFLYDHKGKLNYLNKICFPRIDDDDWSNIDSELSYVNEPLYSLAIQNPNLKLWLHKLGVEKKTDITYLNTVIIPNATTYCTDDNHSKTIKYIYDLYSNEDIKSNKLEQLTGLKLLTAKGALLPASQCYFSDRYNPKLQIENILDKDIFLSEEYLSLDRDIEEIKRFFKLLGVEENIIPIVITDKESKTNLTSNLKFKNNYFLESDKKFKPYQSIFTADEYKNLIYIKFISKTSIYNFSKLFWSDLIENNDVAILNKSAQAYWGVEDFPGRTTGDEVENYPKWYIKNEKCLPTTKETCKKATEIFLNTEAIKVIAGKYLPVFDGVELNQDWKSFFQFKTELELNDYLKLLTDIMNDKNDEDKVKTDNKKRVQLIFKELLELSKNWGTYEIDKLKYWVSSAYLSDEEDHIVLCSELKYYADGDNSIFQNIHKFIALNQENKAHQYIETFLEYLGVEVLRQSSFSIKIEGEKIESDLKYKIKEVSSYLKAWIIKTDKDFDNTFLDEKFSFLQVDEAFKLSLSYDGTILKSVQVHLEENSLLVTVPWNSNKSMLELPKILCGYFNIKGYEHELGFLLKANEDEIIEYFESEKIDVPIKSISAETEEVLTKEEATTLNITEKEYDEISNNFKHTSESSIEKLEYIQTLLPRARSRILEHLNSLDEYNCDNVDTSALTVLSGITKNGNDIYIIPRPSDNGKVILYYPSEFDALEYADSELWYENGVSIPKKLTFGKVLREAKINKIPITKTTKNIIDNPTNEDIAYKSILPSPFDTAKIMASLANTNGGYLIIGCSREDGIIGLNSEVNIDDLISKSIEYSSCLEKFKFEKKKIDGKTLIFVKIDKSDEIILIKGKTYIRYGSIIIDELTSNKPLIITEGKTDWKHIKKALERFKDDGLYTDLDIQFLEYEDMNMGDCELDRMVQTYSKIEQTKKHIFMFDRDNKTYVKKYAKEDFNNHKNNVYSFCIPKINGELDEICIELYYEEEDLTTENANGKRVFIGKEFNPKNGISKCGKYMTEKRNAKELDILDRDKKVYSIDDKEWENNIALSKNDFTDNVVKDVEGFDNFDIEHFKLIFNVIEKINNDK